MSIEAYKRGYKAGYSKASKRAGRIQRPEVADHALRLKVAIEHAWRTADYVEGLAWKLRDQAAGMTEQLREIEAKREMVA